MEKGPPTIQPALPAAALALGMIASVTVLPLLGSTPAAEDMPAPPAKVDHDGPTSDTLDVSPASAGVAFAGSSHSEAAKWPGRSEWDEAALREHIRRNPTDQAARRQLMDMVRHRVLPRDSRPYRATRALLPDGFVEHETRRFVVLSDADPRWTLWQADRLERAHHQFQRFARQLDLDPLPLEHKLVCVLFQRHEDFIHFAATHDEVNARWMSGYYSPQHQRIVFYNVETGAGVSHAQEQIGLMRSEIAALKSRAAEARHAGEQQAAMQIDEHVRRYQRHLVGESQRLEAFAADAIVSTTVHEAFHLLAFHTLVQNPYVDYPIWLSEGLATAFETDSPNSAFGPDREHPARRSAFLEFLRAGRLIPLRELIPITDLNDRSSEDVSVIYHQSYALITWLHRFRRSELQLYLKAMRAAAPGRMEPTNQIALFEQAFGDVDQLERAWLRSERSLSAVHVGAE